MKSRFLDTRVRDCQLPNSAIIVMEEVGHEFSRNLTSQFLTLPPLSTVDTTRTLDPTLTLVFLLLNPSPRLLSLVLPLASGMSILD